MATKLVHFFVDFVAAGQLDDRNGLDGVVVIDAIKNMDGVPGITGSFSFDDDNNPIKSVAIIELTSGDEVYKEMYKFRSQSTIQ